MINGTETGPDIPSGRLYLSNANQTIITRLPNGLKRHIIRGSIEVIFLEEEVEHIPPWDINLFIDES